MKKCIFVFLLSWSYLAQAREGDNFNILFSPILPIIGVIQSEVTYKVSPHWTLGPTFMYLNWSLFDLKIKGTSLGLSGRYYFNESYQDSWFGRAEAGASTLEVSTTESGTTYSSSASSGYFKVGAGYHWFWDMVNLELAAVAAQDSAGKVEIKNSSGKVIDSYSTLTVGGEFLLGFTF